MRRVLAWAVLIGAAAIAGLSFVFMRDMRAAREAIGESVIVETGAGPIEYAVAGGGAPLLSIHGAGGGFDQGLDNATGFVGEGFQVIAPSRFGYLRTPIPDDASVAAQADAHAALLDVLGVKRAAVVGVSAGARSALELALRHPTRVQALILIVPGTYAPESPVMIAPGRGNDFAFWAVNHGGDFFWWAAERVSPSTLTRFLGVPPEAVEAASADERARVARVRRSVLPLSQRFRGINVDSQPDLHPSALERVNTPTLLISARDDLFNTGPAAAYAAAHIPNARLFMFESGGHLLVGRGEEVRGAIRDFLDETRER